MARGASLGGLAIPQVVLSFSPNLTLFMRECAWLRLASVACGRFTLVTTRLVYFRVVVDVCWRASSRQVAFGMRSAAMATGCAPGDARNEEGEVT